MTQFDDLNEQRQSADLRNDKTTSFSFAFPHSCTVKGFAGKLLFIRILTAAVPMSEFDTLNKLIHSFRTKEL